MKKVFKIVLLVLFSAAQSYPQEVIKKDSTYIIQPEIIILSKHEMYVPNKIQIIDKETIINTNGTRLSDVLNQSSAIFIKDYGFNSGLKTISLNATQSEQTSIFYNGVKLNGRDNSQYDLGLLQLDDIDNITISNGGSSALYGNEAIGGVINIRTISDDELNFSKNRIGLTVDAGIGSYGMKKLYSKFQHKPFRKLFYDISLGNESSDNGYSYMFNDGTNEIIKHRQNADYRNYHLNAESLYDISQATALEFFTVYNFWNRGVPGIEIGYAPSAARQIDRDLISSAKISHNFNNHLTLLTNIYYKYTLRNYFDTSTYTTSAPINSFYKLNTLGGTGILEYKYGNNSVFHLSYEGSYNNFRSDQADEGNDFEGSISISARHEINTKLFRSLSLFPSIRYDYYSSLENKNILTGKFGLNCVPFHKINLGIKSTIGNNFRAPSFDDIYWKNLGNKNLKPEQSVSIDAGIYYDFRLPTFTVIEISYFNINTTDRILWIPGNDNIWRPVNIGKVKSEGIEANLKSSVNISSRIKLSLSAGTNYSTSIKKSEDFPGDAAYGKQLIYIPQEYSKVSGGIDYLTKSKVIKFVSLNLFYSYTGKRFIDPENDYFTPHYVLLDANFSWGLHVLKTDINIKFEASNILNENYQVISGYPMPLRNYRFQISFKY